MDVVTRWNRSLGMLERYLEQQAAITAALLSPEVRKNARQLDTMGSADISDAEEIVNLLKPLKKTTTVLSDEKSATLSLIMPLKSMIEQSMTLDEKDSTTVSDMKTAILQNLSSRYTEAGTVGQTEPMEEGATDGNPIDAADAMHRVEQEQPPSKKTALEDLLGATFAKIAAAQSKSRMEVEIDMYKKDTSIPLTSCPLKWWKENAQMCPLLSSLAKAYLIIPATSVPSERVFSTAGDTVNAQRSQLSPKHVDMLAKKPVSNLKNTME
ncbi:hypothetical protein QTP70_001808 [Hemibagrus guttatus]|uniref:HAT C-terminal dimerisation domain-containing protein n=1 Tax=Hemibagrus guttatus TaxID=175788 RepID=A0AAE0VB78_9TELE|nr:hypothetical protein QTP70_001808 [Hemibagrus guttatus]KAK3571250.1 hypothetical protein QTP86_005961 [Hemibagrus guttatus]